MYTVKEAVVRVAVELNKRIPEYGLQKAVELGLDYFLYRGKKGILAMAKCIDWLDENEPNEKRRAQLIVSSLSHDLNSMADMSIEPRTRPYLNESSPEKKPIPPTIEKDRWLAPWLLN